MRYPKRLIEVDLPIARISAHARREKSIRHGHISTLHIWWARRPLAACRAVICAALWPDPADPLCPQTFRSAAAEQLTAFARRVFPVKITQEGRQLQSEKHLSPEGRGRWEGLLQAEKEGCPLDSTDPDHQHVLRGALLDFIADFANWDNSTIPAYLETSRALTGVAHQALSDPHYQLPPWPDGPRDDETRGVWLSTLNAQLSTLPRPLVVDPFAGGGSIPLEALRVGADAFASDLNPVAVLLNKVVLEYIPRYGQRLAEEVRRWGQWVKEQAEQELAEFYPDGKDGESPAAYLWARTIVSSAPAQNGAAPIEIPLIRSMWLCKKPQKKVALRWVRDQNGEIKCEDVERRYLDGKDLRVRIPLLEVFEPNSATDVEDGTSHGGAGTCPVTGFTNSVQSIRDQLSARRGGAGDARLVAVVTKRRSTPGRFYRLPTEQDATAVQNARNRFDSVSVTDSGGFVSPPDGELNHLRGFFNVVLYGMKCWGDLFSPRQLLTLTTLARLVRSVPQRARARISDIPGLDVALQSCLALAVSRHADINASLAMWHNTRELITHVFGRQALPMVWDFAEANSFGDASGSFDGGVDWIARVLEQPISEAGQAELASATTHPLPDEAVDAVISDPPYYAAIPYADLSDFFYSWLRPCLIRLSNVYKMLC